VAKVQYYCAATLDGYIADSDDGIEWLTGYEGSEELFDEMVASAGDRKLWVMGGGDVASQFVDAGLLDEPS
jgi:dihydrofolate reductase